MTDPPRPICSWTGVADEDDKIVACDRPASAVVLDRHGNRLYSCEEHLASAKARASSGKLELGLRRRRLRPHDTAPPPVHVVLT